MGILARVFRMARARMPMLPLPAFFRQRSTCGEKGGSTAACLTVPAELADDPADAAFAKFTGDAFGLHRR